MNTVLDDDEKKLLDDFDRLCNEIKQRAKELNINLSKIELTSVIV